MSPKLTKFCDFYSSFGMSNLDVLHEVYADSVVFKDPVHEVNGLDAMRRYIANLCSQLLHCHFSFHNCIEEGDRVFLSWTMEYAHPKVSGGKTLYLDGATEIKFSGDKVCYHCDYYDMGAMLYERLPLIGAVIGWLRHRLA